MVLLTLVLTPISLQSNHKQPAETPADMYQKVPEDRRQSLREAVDNLIGAEQRADWKAVYQLRERTPGETEADFLRYAARGRPLREFRLTKIVFIPPDDSWVIRGCASFGGDLKERGHVADITAKWRDSRWYLSVVAFVLLGNEKGGKLQDCSIP